MNNECQRQRRVSRGDIATTAPKSKHSLSIHQDHIRIIGCLAWRNVDNAEGASAAGVAIKEDCCIVDGPLLWERCIWDAP